MSPEDHGAGLSWEAMASGHDSKSGSDSWMSLQLFLQETSSFKQQNPGKFCLLVCSLCTFLAVVGRYIPGIVVSYIIVLAVFLGPVISWQDVTRWLEPVLQKLDFGLVHLLRRVKEDHERRLLQTQTEPESIEADLSSMFPKLDSTVCKEMSISDTEASEGAWTDNGTFNLSEGHTPQTENSEDLDREEVFTGGLLEFPSLDNGMATNGDDDSDLSLGLPSPPPPPPAAPLLRRDPGQQALEMVHCLARDAMAAAMTAAIQERLEGAVSQTQTQTQSQSPNPELSLESDSEVEDFELLDQSELETLEGELGLRPNKSPAQGEAVVKPGKTSSGFFSKLLGRR
ncbi:reticulophagy regulator 1 isoform 2-T2 [Aplochiton taeniatus]